MRSPCAGAALDPPSWILPNKAFSLSLTLSPRLSNLCSVLDQGKPPNALFQDILNARYNFPEDYWGGVAREAQDLGQLVG